MGTMSIATQFNAMLRATYCARGQRYLKHFNENGRQDNIANVHTVKDVNTSSPYAKVCCKQTGSCLWRVERYFGVTAGSFDIMDGVRLKLTFNIAALSLDCCFARLCSLLSVIKHIGASAVADCLTHSALHVRLKKACRPALQHHTADITALLSKLHPSLCHTDLARSALILRVLWWHHLYQQQGRSSAPQIVGRKSCSIACLNH
jgi:hypothetical protein